VDEGVIGMRVNSSQGVIAEPVVASTVPRGLLGDRANFGLKSRDVGLGRGAGQRHRRQVRLWPYVSATPVSLYMSKMRPQTRGAEATAGGTGVALPWLT
jgi:hypothetical protein